MSISCSSMTATTPAHLRQRLRRAVERRWASRPACAADRRARRLLCRLCRRRRPDSWRAAWPRASSIRASPRAYRDGEPRGTPSGDLPPTAFVLFLQNHDQIGNRAVRRPADRRCADPEALEAAIALLLLCPQIPLIFMGEEARAARRSCSSPTTTASWPRRCARDGAREFAGFAGFQAGETADAFPIRMRRRPSTQPARGGRRAGRRRQALYRQLWRCAPTDRAAARRAPRRMAAHAVGPAGACRALAAGRRRDTHHRQQSRREPAPIERPAGRLLFESRAGAGEQASHGRLDGPATVAFLEPPR